MMGLKMKLRNIIFILLSIKTRIETHWIFSISNNSSIFLSYYPLKQGLKRRFSVLIANSDFRFLSYYPLKQGLKHLDRILLPELESEFLSYYPLKQGLKPKDKKLRYLHSNIFILLSIKTRIETSKKEKKNG